jgi:hypothetical protein
LAAAGRELVAENAFAIMAPLVGEDAAVRVAIAAAALSTGAFLCAWTVEDLRRLRAGFYAGLSCGPLLFRLTRFSEDGQHKVNHWNPKAGAVAVKFQTPVDGGVKLLRVPPAVMAETSPPPDAFRVTPLELVAEILATELSLSQTLQ